MSREHEGFSSEQRKGKPERRNRARSGKDLPSSHGVIHKKEPPSSPRFDIARCSEWKVLQHSDMAVSPEAAAATDKAVEYFPEERRTRLSVTVLGNIYEGGHENWEQLTQVQSPDRKLSYRQYENLNRMFRTLMPDEKTYQAMMYTMLIHDIAKNPDVMRAVELDPEHGNHDDGLRRLLSPDYREQQERFLPTFADPNMLDDRQRSMISGILDLDFNFPGFALSQTSARELAHIESVDRNLLALHAIHGILDVAGTIVDDAHPLSSPVLDQPNTIRLMTAMTALVALPEQIGLAPEDTITGEMRNKLYLSLTAQRLAQEQSSEEPLPMDSDLLTQAQLANMFRFETPQQFDELTESYNNLPFVLRSQLNLGLSQFGYMIGGMHSLDYGPALLRSLTTAHSLEEGLSLFAQILTIAQAVNGEAEMRYDRQPALQLNLKPLVLVTKSGASIERLQAERDKDVLTLVPVDPNKEIDQGRTYQLAPLSLYSVLTIRE